MSGQSEIHIRESPANPIPRTKPAPRANVIGVPFDYAASDDGTDENLLVLLHGLGDTHTPFGKLGHQLHLPQTATLALRAPEQIPFLYEKSFQWYTSFDPLGDLIDRPNPTPALELLSDIFNHLTGDCQWPPQKIHLFGFAQGGSVAAEFALKWWKQQLAEYAKALTNTTDGNSAVDLHLGSLVTVSGPLLSYPTLSKACSTPVLIFHRAAPSESALPTSAIAAFKKAFSSVIEEKVAGEGMPRSKAEWQPIMKFWSERLSRRQGDGLYEILSGSG